GLEGGKRRAGAGNGEGGGYYYGGEVRRIRIVTGIQHLAGWQQRVDVSCDGGGPIAVAHGSGDSDSRQYERRQRPAEAGVVVSALQVRRRCGEAGGGVE